MFATSLDTHDACFILEAYHQKGSGYMENWEQVPKKLDEQRTSLEKKFNQLDLDIDMMIMSSEKATTQQPLKYVEREIIYFEVQVDAFGRESEVKTKEVAASGRPGSEGAQGSAAVLWACVGQQSF